MLRFAFLKLIRNVKAKACCFTFIALFLPHPPTIHLAVFYTLFVFVFFFSPNNLVRYGKVLRHSLHFTCFLDRKASSQFS